MIWPAAKFLVVVGPTAVGKTDVSLHLARALGGEIVSADSRLVYRLMDIGTAKPDRSVRAEIPHHMIDIVSLARQYTAKEYQVGARKAIGEIISRGRVPIVVGGTGLYVRALIRGIFDGPSRDPALRADLEDVARREGPEALWRRLAEVDPEKAKQTDPANLTRVIRALEVFHLAGSPMSTLEKQAEAFAVPGVTVGVTRNRQDLYRRIERRVDRMMETGFLDEVRALVKQGFGQSPVVRDSVGYREAVLHLDGRITLDEAVQLIKKNTRNFAKRQITWFRREPGVTWIDVTGREDFRSAAGEICGLFKSALKAGEQGGPHDL